MFSRSAVLHDEEHSSGARITLEQKRWGIPFEITCGIYGAFFHTAFASSKIEAEEKYSKMKSEISESFESKWSDEELYKWAEQFAIKY
ncbi:hypothetical protein [uncultured Pseudoteredinibacter sp.]|uniref:hypothetical protein n=1 Tax=uncultured Pseudoteredinibacter sp. TaxID=1641701 RepID=UPI00262256EA|nr:hypothetical protein [uncultured Pseudoteredinibacter sp.]